MCLDACAEPEDKDKACGGTVLRCLADKIDDVSDDNCKQELLYFQKMEVSLFLFLLRLAYDTYVHM